MLASGPGSLTIIDLENAVGTALAMAELGVAAPLQIQGRYRLSRLLGRGARGVVCQARDLHLHRDVAIKLVPALGIEVATQEVSHEAQALARLQHANVVGVYDLGDTALTLEHRDGLPLPCLFMTMELVRGQSMRSWLCVAEPDAEQVLVAFHQAGAGLAHAHESGVVHRDFKPDNVVIADDGRVLVVDFGLAHRSYTQPDVQSTALMLWTGGVAGTPEYMAPEALDGRADARSDQYSFALSLYEALTGTLPGWTAAGTRPLDVSGLPSLIGQVLVRALAREPARRFASMRELLDELPTRWTETALTKPEPSFDEPPRWSRTWMAGAGVGLAVLATLGFVLSHLMRSTPTDEPDRSTATSASASPAEACPELALIGAWTFDTRIWWDYKLRSIGSRDYELELRRGEGCHLVASLHKPAAKFRGDAVLELRSRNADGSVELRGTWNIEQDYIFDFVFDGDTLMGDYVTFNRWGRPAVKGPLVGARRGESAPKLDGRRDLPCRSQCRLLCAGAEATQRCASEQCVDPRAIVHDCGPPSGDFQPPANCEAILTELERGQWQPAVEGRACERVVPVLVGGWTVHERRHSGELIEWKVSLREAPGCRLLGTAHSDDERHDVRVELDTDGQWLLSATDDPSLRWAMCGWEFASGLAASPRPARLRGQRDFP